MGLPLEAKQHMPGAMIAMASEQTLSRIETRAILRQIAGSRNPATLMSGRRLNANEAARHALEALRDLWFVAQAAGNSHLALLTECAFYEAYLSAGGSVSKAQMAANDLYRSRKAVA